MNAFFSPLYFLCRAVKPEGEGFREGATYDVPDVSQLQTWLEPGTADGRVAHPGRE